MDKQLHFIVGIGRSGTSILSKLLNSYVDVHCLPEANFLVFFLRKYHHKKQFTALEIEAIFEEINLYTLSHPMVGWTFDEDATKHACMQLLKASKSITYKEICIMIYQNFKVNGLNKDRATLLIDKNPSYTIFIDKIHSALPESKFIFIVRDYRANILSRKQSVYLKSPDVAYNATRWKLYNKEAYAFYKKNGNKVLLIKYESLVSNYETEIQRITAFLNLNPVFEPENQAEKEPVNIKDYNISEKFRERFIKKYSDLNKELNKERLEVWKEKLTVKEIRLSDAICSGIGKKFGYETNFPTNTFKSFTLKFSSIVPIIKGYIDIYKDKLIYYAPIGLKLNKLRKRYVKLGFIEK
ncbi:MAG: Sulfotransferase domain protein [Bacteroidota bacterium]|jgi:hypothetical protein|nr:Sulfotransferase domain protein [Bacteroidota bacterium]